ncbi:NF-kappa-B-repressing factor [Lucilia cuprina]|uniref:NF-kappa-B-repressing factor n=1 Tax=Lucilia cuprina TaxID=7375 RepID=UPI001F069638|nr:NF-kappa-B-repressing factor [Lucilia cuprina]
MSKTKVKNQNKQKNQKKQKQSDTEFSTDWDVEKYRREYESEEHWQLRKRFMEMHKDKFPEDKLVCLAQVFTNMEFMGCKYPSETMQMVAELSKDVAKEFRADRANRLKRTFVTASDAAEARAKGRKSTQQTNNVQTASSYQANNKRKGFGNEAVGSDEPLTKRTSSTTLDLFSGLKYGKFVVYLHGDRNCLRLSAQRGNIQYVEKEVVVENGRKQVEIRLNEQIVATACEENLKASKAEAFRKALATLQQQCYTIKQNPLRDTIKIEKTNNKVVCGVIKTQQEEQKIDATNKGYKMMKMMGWSGGGLGSQKQGREDPVGYLLKNNRAGLGNDACKLDRKYFMQMLKNYVESDDIRELQFEPTFTKDERAMLHEIANKFNLKSTSHGQDEQRRLIINKKTISDVQILQEILINKNPRFMDRYFVQVPQSKSQLFPDYTAVLTL